MNDHSLVFTSSRKKKERERDLPLKLHPKGKKETCLVCYIILESEEAEEREKAHSLFLVWNFRLLV